MKKLLILALFSVVGFARASVLYYGGDIDLNDPNQNGLADETDAIVGGSPYGAATYSNFTLGSNSHITDLFANELISNDLNGQAYWEIRTGMSEGNGGTLVAGGMVSAATITATGRSDFGFTEYNVDVNVSSLNINLNGGTQYWMTVGQYDPNGGGRAFNSNTDRLNGVGTHANDLEFFNSGFFGANYTNADNEGVFSTFSDGVLGQAVPEPMSFAVLGIGALALISRRRRSK